MSDNKKKKVLEKQNSNVNFKSEGRSFNENARKEPENNTVKQALSSKTKHAGETAIERLNNKLENVSSQYLSENKLIKKNRIRRSDILEKNKSKEQLAVYFKCPLIGTEVLTKQEWKEKIREYLNEQLKIEKHSAACLMIHSLNHIYLKNQCIETLASIIKNIILNPGDGKYKKIRIMNKVFQEKVISVAGAVEFLEVIGFLKKSISVDSKQEDYFVYPNKNPDIAFLQEMLDLLINTKAITLQLWRNVKVIKPKQIPEKTELPDEFYIRTLDEVKREQIKRNETLDNSKLLKTNEMREKENQMLIRKYRYTLIRIRFPDGHYLQGTFGVDESLGVVRSFVSENISSSVSFSLTTAVGDKLPEVKDEKTLEELKLVPAVILIFVPKVRQPSGQSFLLPHL